MDSVAVVFRLSVSPANVKRIEYFGIWVQGPRTAESLALSCSISIGEMIPETAQQFRAAEEQRRPRCTRWRE